MCLKVKDTCPKTTSSTGKMMINHDTPSVWRVFPHLSKVPSKTRCENGHFTLYYPNISKHIQTTLQEVSNSMGVPTNTSSLSTMLQGSGAAPGATCDFRGEPMPFPVWRPLGLPVSGDCLRHKKARQVRSAQG